MKNLIMALMAMLCLSRTMAQTSPCEDSRLNIYGLCIEPERDKNGDVIDYTSVFSETHLAHQEVHFHVSPLLEENGSTFIDFDNGQGFQPYSIASMSPKIVIYATSGAKTIRFENIDGSDTTRWSKQLSILDNGSYAYTAPDDIWTFETGDFTPPCSNAYPNNHPYSQTAKAKGRAYIKYADASNPVLRNPVVFVEGFDFFKEAYFDPQTGDTIRFGRIGWDVMTRGLSNGTGEQIFREMPIQINDFQLNGYDLVYLDIEDGTDYIQRSALLVMQLLDEINAKKACDGEEIVVIGASMGGQVVRYALTKMEQENRYHGVRTYVSFDAPHQGAVVPMSVQSAIWGLAHLSHPSNIDENTTKLWDGLNSPAARQMLYETFLGEVKAGNVTSAMNIVDISGNPQGPGFPIGWFSPMSLDYDCLRDGFVAERAALGYPKYTRNIALVNGSKQAVTQDFNQWDKLVRAETIIGTLVPFRLILKPTPNTPILDMKVPISFMGNTSIPSFYTQFDVNANSLLPYDIAPGCTQNFTEVLAKELSKKDDMYIIDEKSRHCFMPTISTLDINTANLNLNVDNSFPIVNNLTPFKAFHAPDTNEAHVKITSAGRGFLNSQIALNTNQLNNVVLNAGDAYNFGGDYSFLNNFTVGNGANVGINRPNIPTGHPNSGNEAPIGVFDAHTGLCGITIEDGGLLEVGSGWDNRVTLRVLNGSTVRIKKGGKIIVHGYSKIIVEEGGTLIVEDGGQINYWGNNTSNPATLRIEGTLIVEDNGGDNTDKAEFFGSGHMEVANTATFDIQEDAHLSLDGQASNDRILDLEQNARFGVEEKARLTIRNGNVNYEGNSTIYVENKGYLTMVALNLNGVLSANAIESDNPERIIVSGVSFRDFGIGVLIYNGTTNAELNYAVMSSTFTNCEWGIVAENTTSVKSSGNVFNAESNGTLGIWCIKTKLVKIANNLVDGYLDKGISLDDVPVCQVKNTIISNSVVGIYGRNKSNVFLSHNSILQNNTVGIELYGDKDDGMVSMNCATLDNNGTGILGTDVLLDIDAEVHSYDPNYISPNSFKNFGNNQRIFDICYKDRNITEIFAKNNYWDGLSTLTPNIDFRIYKGTGACNGNSNVALITANATTIEPQGCNYQNITATGGGNGSAIMMTANQCSLSVNSQAYAIETQYKLGDEKFKEEQFEEADLKYAPVSALEGPVRDGSSTPCRHYIDVAHVMVKVEEILNTQKSGSSTNPFDLWDDAAKMVNATQRIATLTAYPNPASDVVTIRIMDNVDGRGIIKLYNTLGQEVYANSANGNIIEIPVKQLSAGFYRAEWISNAGNWSGVAKVVVQ